MSTFIAHILFGQVSFLKNEEYQEFQYKFLMVLMVSGALFTAFFMGVLSRNPRKFQNLVFSRHFEHPLRDFVHVTGNLTGLLSIFVLILGVTRMAVFGDTRRKLLIFMYLKFSWIWA